MALTEALSFPAKALWPIFPAMKAGFQLCILKDLLDWSRDLRQPVQDTNDIFYPLLYHPGGNLLPGIFLYLREVVVNKNSSSCPVALRHFSTCINRMPPVQHLSRS